MRIDEEDEDGLWINEDYYGLALIIAFWCFGWGVLCLG